MRFDRRKYDAGVSPGADWRPSFSRTVPRELVHRRAISEVFMTDIRRIGDGRYLAAAQWPRLHPFFYSRPGAYDTALIAESLRQATILVAHAMEGVPMGQIFLMPDMSVHAPGGHSSDPGTPTEVNMLLDVKVSQRNAHGPAVLRVKARFELGGHPIATGTAGARLVDPASYARLRLRPATDGQPPQTVPLPPERAGHRFSHNVAIGAGSPADSWPLHVDATNPTFFDHPLDHVPGLLMVEGIRQALRVRMMAPNLDFQSFEASFLKIVELDDDASVSLQTVVIEDQKTGRATAAITVNEAVCVELSCRFTLNAAKGPRRGLPLARRGGQGPGTQPVSSREPSPAGGLTTCPRSVPEHQRDE